MKRFATLLAVLAACFAVLCLPLQRPAALASAAGDTAAAEETPGDAASAEETEKEGFTERLAKKIYSALPKWLNGSVAAFLISMLPILECRGGMIVAALANVKLLPAFFICYIGNMIPIPFILLLIKRIFAFMKAHHILTGFIEKLEGKTDKNREKVLRYKQWGLLAFVAVPLPGTGGWTGSLFAALLDIDFKKALPIVALGVFIADLIMAIISYGVKALNMDHEEPALTPENGLQPPQPNVKDLRIPLSEDDEDAAEAEAQPSQREEAREQSRLMREKRRAEAAASAPEREEPAPSSPAPYDASEPSSAPYEADGGEFPPLTGWQTLFGENRFYSIATFVCGALCVLWSLLFVIMLLDRRISLDQASFAMAQQGRLNYTVEYQSGMLGVLRFLFGAVVASAAVWSVSAVVSDRGRYLPGSRAVLIAVLCALSLTGALALFDLGTANLVFAVLK